MLNTQGHKILACEALRGYSRLMLRLLAATIYSLSYIAT